MLSARRSVLRIGAIGVIACAGVVGMSHQAHAQPRGSVVPLSLNALMANNNSGDGQGSWGGMQSFAFGNGSGNTSTISESPNGEYSGFIWDRNVTNDTASADGGGIGVTFYENNASPFNYLLNNPILGINAADFPVFDRAGFGGNFDPDDYMIEVEYKPLPTNQAAFFNVNIAQIEGFKGDPAAATQAGKTGQRVGEQLQWQFLGINSYYTANVQANGYATIRQNLTNAMGVSTQINSSAIGSFFYGGDPSTFENAETVEPGNVLPDFDAFKNLTPSGALQIQMQSSFSEEFDQNRVHLDIRDIRVVRRVKDTLEVARMDAWSGISRRFGNGYSNTAAGGADTIVPYDVNGDGVVSGVQDSAFIRPTTQLRRFDQNGYTNIFVDTDDNDGLNEFGVWQDPFYQTFDGTNAHIELKAKLTQEFVAGGSISIKLEDLDGNDTGPGTGGEEYLYAVDLSQLNTTSMTTISIDLDAFTQHNLQAFELQNTGDGLLTDFNLYYLGVQALAGNPLVHLEIESLRILLNSAPGLQGDFNGDHKVDAADYTVWRNNLGQPEGTLLNGNGNGGTIDSTDYALWKSQFGEQNGSGSFGNSAVPEPSGLMLGLAALGLAGCGRRRNS